MATVQSVIDSARYDLIDFADGVGLGIEYDDAELLNYVNRMVGLMDSTLSSLNSDLVEAEETDIDCVESQAYVDISGLNSGNWSRIRNVWIGSSRLTHISLWQMRYTRMFRSDDARPMTWALYNQQILFPTGCDDSYTDLNIYYDKKTGSLVLTDSMPYSDIFNEFIREMVVMVAKAKKEKALDRSDAVFNNLFRARAMQEEIARNFIPRGYNYMEF